MDPGTSYPIDSCIRSYTDWTTGYSSVPSPEVHFVWLSDSFVPFAARPGQEVILPDSMLGLPPVTSWPACGGHIPWVLDLAEHPRPDDTVVSRGSAGPDEDTGGSKSKKRKKKSHRHRELRVTKKGVGDDEPQFVAGSSSDPSGSDESDTTVADSGVNLASPISTRLGRKKAKVTGPSILPAVSTISRTPPLSPNTRWRLDGETLGKNETQQDDDGLLSGHSNHAFSDGDGDGDQEMSSVEEFSDGDEEDGKDVPMDVDTTTPQAPFDCNRYSNALHLQ